MTKKDLKQIILTWTANKLDKLTHKQLTQLIAKKRMHQAKLVWVTPKAEELIARLARVSNPKNENNPEYVKLLGYLIKHKHWSPFEMASMCVEINDYPRYSSSDLAPQKL